MSLELSNLFLMSFGALFVFAFACAIRYFKDSLAEIDLIKFSIIFNVIFLIGIPLILFRYFDAENNYLEGIEREKLIAILNVAIGILLYFVPAFYFIAKKTELFISKYSFVRHGNYNLRQIGIFVSFLGLLGFCFELILLISDEATPLRRLFSGEISAIELAYARSDFSQAKDPLAIIAKEIIKNYLPLIFPLILALHYEGTRWRLKSSSMITAFFCSLLATMWSIEKLSIIYFTLSVVAVRLIYGWRPNLKKIIFIGSSSLLALLTAFYFIYLSKIETEGIEYLFEIFTHRASTQAVGYILALFYFPDLIDFRYLSGISNALASLQDEKFASVYGLVIDYAAPEFADVSGAMSSFSAGDAWGLFGTVGVIFCPIVLGWYYGVANAAMWAKNKLPIVPIFVLLFSRPYISTGFYGFIYPVGFLQVLLPYWVMLIYFRTQKKRTVVY